MQSAQNFLEDLLLPHRTPRVSKAIRNRARSILMHYPGWFERKEMLREADVYLAEANRLDPPDPARRVLDRFKLRG